MNCLEFHRAVTPNPRQLSVEAARHIERCSACSIFYALELQHEARLEEALRVRVPGALEARILARAALARRPARWLALAASLVLAAGIGFLIGVPRPDPLAMAGIDFVVHEEAQSIIDAKPTDLQLLARVAREMGVSLPDQLGRISYICIYPIAGEGAHHLLVSTPLGKLTLLLFPGRTLASRTAAAAHGLKAAVVPTAKGAVAIIGSSPHSVSRAETLLKPS